MNLHEIKASLERRKGSRNNILSDLKKAKKNVRSLHKQYRMAEKALAIIQLVSQQTQEELRYQLSELPKLALQGVFDDPYEFDMSIEIRRGKTEADFWFVRDDCRLSPKDNSGLGSVDIAGMALRPALWSLKSPKNRACIWLDEPFKHLKGVKANSRALTMLKEICEPKPSRGWPGLQIIMIADERAPRDELLNAADRLFEFTMAGRKTKIKIIR